MIRFELPPLASAGRERLGQRKTTPREEGHTHERDADRVKKIVVEHLGVEAEKVTEEASFIDDLGADSLDIVELVMAFEEEFGVEIPDDAAEKITHGQGRDRLYRGQQGLRLGCRRPGGCSSRLT